MISTEALLSAIESHALTLGQFERVNRHEPKNAPGAGLTAAIWVQTMRPAALVSGLDKTSGVLEFTIRVYTGMVQEPQDMIDPQVIAAVDALMVAFSGDYSLGGLVKHVDLLGAHSVGLSAKAGYLNIGGTMYRVMDITLPLIINDSWEQVA